MVSIRGYLSSSFTQSLLVVFLPIYIIISLSYLIRISVLTEKVSMGFGDLLELYAYSVPEILFYTLPFSFVIAIANLFSKLSQENELIALFSLGLQANKLLSAIWVIAALFSVLLIAISFILLPWSMQEFKSFRETIKSTTKIELNSGVLGQKFGDYYVYIDAKTKDKLKDLVIYRQTPNGKEHFFAAKEGKLQNQEESISLLLIDGYGYTYDQDKLQEAKYETLTTVQTFSTTSLPLQNIPDYWAEAMHDHKRVQLALFSFFVSLIPLLSVYLISAITIVNPRYQSSNTTASTFVVTVVLFGIASYLQKKGDLLLVPLVVIGLVAFGRYLFYKRVARFF